MKCVESQVHLIKGAESPRTLKIYMFTSSLKSKLPPLSGCSIGIILPSSLLRLSTRIIPVSTRCFLLALRYLQYIISPNHKVIPIVHLVPRQPSWATDIIMTAMQKLACLVMPWSFVSCTCHVSERRVPVQNIQEKGVSEKWLRGEDNSDPLRGRKEP